MAEKPQHHCESEFMNVVDDEFLSVPSPSASLSPKSILRMKLVPSSGGADNSLNGSSATSPNSFEPGPDNEKSLMGHGKFRNSQIWFGDISNPAATSPSSCSDVSQPESAFEITIIENPKFISTNRSQSQLESKVNACGNTSQLSVSSEVLGELIQDLEFDNVLCAAFYDPKVVLPRSSHDALLAVVEDPIFMEPFKAFLTSFARIYLQKLHNQNEETNPHLSGILQDFDSLDTPLFMGRIGRIFLSHYLKSKSQIEPVGVTETVHNETTKETGGINEFHPVRLDETGAMNKNGCSVAMAYQYPCEQLCKPLAADAGTQTPELKAEAQSILASYLQNQMPSFSSISTSESDASPLSSASSADSQAHAFKFDKQNVESFAVEVVSSSSTSSSFKNPTNKKFKFPDTVWKEATALVKDDDSITQIARLFVSHVCMQQSGEAKEGSLQTQIKKRKKKANQVLDQEKVQFLINAMAFVLQTPVEYVNQQLFEETLRTPMKLELDQDLDLKEELNTKIMAELCQYTNQSNTSVNAKKKPKATTVKVSCDFSCIEDVIARIHNEHV